MDYKKLLAKYMWHVGQCEGIDYVDSINIGEIITHEEYLELDKISGDIPDSFKN